MAPVDQSDLTGKWKLCRSENFEGFLTKMGVNWMIRKLAVQSSPVCTISHDGDHWKISTKTGFFTREHEFNVGEEFEAEGMSKKQKCTATWDGAKLAVTSKPLPDQKGFTEINTREVTEEGLLLLTVEVDPDGEPVVCKRWFNKEA